MVEEARLEAVTSGVAPASEGWFVVNVRDAAWLKNDAFGLRCVFEANPRVLSGRPDLEPIYPRSEVALARGAGVETETDSSREAYAPFAHWRPSGRGAGRGCPGLSSYVRGGSSNGTFTCSRDARMSPGLNSPPVHQSPHTPGRPSRQRCPPVR